MLAAFHTITRSAAAHAACAMAAVLATPAHAQPVNAPVQYWIDLSTGNMMGMDDMPEMAGGMFGGMMGNRVATGRDGKQAAGIGNFGQTKQIAMGRWMDTALFTQKKPGGTEGTHQIPAGATVGAAPLQLVTPPRDVLAGREETTYPDRPTGRLLFYWGCGSQVRAGQPRVLDFSKLGQADYTNFMQGRSVRDRGARAEPGHAIWPNDRQNARVARTASLAGEHTLSGDGVPANMRFTLGQQADFMQAMQVSAPGQLNASIRVSWQPVANARAYLLMAMSGTENRGGGAEAVIWSSSEPPESGAGLMDYISNPNVDKWLAERVLLPASQTHCEIPAGIFAKSDGAMLQSIAYGQETHIVHPPRPANPKAPWTPEWAVQVRTKSQSMVSLGEERASGNPGSRGRSEQRSAPRAAEQRPAEAEKPAGGLIPGLPSGVGDVLKGIFGR
jgi:hypothetical protein